MNIRASGAAFETVEYTPAVRRLVRGDPRALAALEIPEARHEDAIDALDAAVAEAYRAPDGAPLRFPIDIRLYCDAYGFATRADAAVDHPLGYRFDLDGATPLIRYRPAPFESLVGPPLCLAVAEISIRAELAQEGGRTAPAAPPWYLALFRPRWYRAQRGARAVAAPGRAVPPRDRWYRAACVATPRRRVPDALYDLAAAGRCCGDDLVRDRLARFPETHGRLADHARGLVPRAPPDPAR